MGKHIESTVFFLIGNMHHSFAVCLRHVWRIIYTEKNIIRPCDESENESAITSRKFSGAGLNDTIYKNAWSWQ